MAKQVINIGQTANDRSGDPLRTAFNKVNANFTELYESAGTGSTSVTIADTEPTSPVAGNLWWESDTGILKIYYTDVDSSQWVDAMPTPVIVTDRLVNGAKELVLNVDGDRAWVDFPAAFGDSISVQGAEIGAVTGNISMFAKDDLQLSANGLSSVKTWLFDKSGTVTTPLMFPLTFTAVLDTEHMLQGVALTDTPWQFEVTFEVGVDGSITTLLDNPFPNPVNPGYVSGYEFEFVEADHDIPGYTFTIALEDVVLPGGAGWTANPAVSAAPAYPSTVTTTGVMALHGNTAVVLENGSGVHKEQFKFVGRNLLLPGNGDIRRFDGQDYVSVLNTANTGNITFVDNTISSDTSIVNIEVTDLDVATVGDTTSTTTIASKIETDINDIVIGRITTQTVDDGVISATDEAGSRLTVTGNTTSLETYSNPEGPNNTQMARAYTGALEAGLEVYQEDVGGQTGASVIVNGSTVEITQGDGVIDGTWTFTARELSLPAGGSIVDSNGEDILLGYVTGTPWTEEGYLVSDGTGLIYGSRLVYVNGNGSDLIFQTESTQWGKIVANGTDGFGIKGGGDVKVIANTTSWNFGTDSNLTLPQTGNISVTGVTAADLVTLETTYTDNEGMYQDALTAWMTIDSFTPVWYLLPGRLAYDEMIAWTPPEGVTLPSNLPPVAIACRNAYLAWQEAIANSKLSVKSDTATWTFDSENKLVLSQGGVIAGGDAATVQAAYDDWQADEANWQALITQDGFDTNIRPWNFAGPSRTEKLAVLTSMWQTQQTGSLLNWVPISASLYNQVRSWLAVTVNQDGYETWRKLTTSVNITSDDQTWTFTNDGKLTVPGAITSAIDEDVLITTSYTAMSSPPGNVVSNTFTFGANGDLTLPGNIVKALDEDLVIALSQTIMTSPPGPASLAFTFKANGSLQFPDSTVQTTAWTGIAPTPSSIVNGVHTLAINADGTITSPGDVTQSSQDNTVCGAGIDTVIYTASAQNKHAIKLFVMVEGSEGGAWETQACDIIAVRGYVNDIVSVMAYGITYSGNAALATFDGQWNATTNRIEITCQPTGASNVTASVHAIELTSND